MSTFSQFTGGNKIKSIQRGTITIPASASSATATIASVDTTKTELRMLGFSSNHNDTHPYNVLFPRISLTSSTQITAVRSAANGYSIVVSWELTEFE